MTLRKLESPTFPFPYEIVRSRRKTLVLYIRGGKVEVRSPLKASSHWIHSFLHKNSAWIQQQLAAQRLKLRERLVISDNRLVPFLGKPRRIKVISSAHQKALLKGDHLYLFARNRQRENLEKLFQNWLQERAREYMVSQTIKYARQLRVSNRLKDVVFRKTRSKWGHCCQDGTIQYNWLAMMAPRSVVNYLIAHETAHLRHLDHSSRFWDTVGEICPKYREHRQWLSDNGHRFWSVPVD